MLYKKTWRQNANRHYKCLVHPTTTVPYIFNSTVIRTGARDKSGHKQQTSALWKPMPVWPPRWCYLIPSTVLAFVHTPTNKIFARVQTCLGWQLLIPAVRNMTTRQVINTPARRTGTFVPLNTVDSRQVVSNIILPCRQHPTLLRAPGTYARVNWQGPTVYLQLPRQRRLQISPHALVQLGANAAHAHWHCVVGKAGRLRTIGKTPHVRMAAKNPVNRMSTRQRLKRFNTRSH